MRALAVALALLNASMPVSPQEPGLYEQGTAARQRGDHKAAKEAFAKMLEQNPNSQGALEGISLACMALGQYAEAYAHLKRWNDLAPHSAYVLDLLDRAQRSMSQESTPAPPAPPPTPQNPETGPSLYDLGTQARERGDNQAAKDYFAKMLLKNPDSPGALEGLSLACMALGQYDEALRHLAHWDELSPHNAYIQDLIARAQRGQVAAVAPSPAPTMAKPQPPSLYELGTQARQRGDYQGSKEYFLQMLQQEPESGGALEGLSLACLSLGQYEEARKYLQEWNKNSPHSAYILGLLARAQRGMNDDQGAVETNLQMVEASPDDLGLRRHVDSIMTEDQPGLFATGKISKSLVTEELNTPNPQRIDYEGRSGGLNARVKATPTLNLTGGANYAEDAQINLGGNFIYYDLLEQIYWMGFELKPRRSLFFSAQYGQDVVTNARGNGLEKPTLFSRAKFAARAHWLRTDWSLSAERAPYFLRGSSGNNYFAFLRDDSARLQAETDLLGLTWRGRVGVDDISDGTTLKSWGVLGNKEIGPYLFQPGYSHGDVEFFGASPTGRLLYVLTDRYGFRARRFEEEKYSLSASGGYTYYADANRQTDASAEALGWLPWFKELSGGYRFAYSEFLASPLGYNNTSTTDHYLVAYWQHHYAHQLWTRFGYEHGFRWDAVRQHYEGSTWLGELEWYRRGDLSLKAQGRYGVSTVKDNYYSAGLQARYSFR